MKNENTKIRKAVAKALGLKKLSKNLHLDHKVAIKDGGTNHPSNLQLLPKQVHHRKTAAENRLRAISKKNAQSKKK